MSHPRPLTRWLEPFAASLWILFLVWTILVALVWTLDIGEAEALGWTQRQFHLPPLETGANPPPLAAALIAFLGWLDPVWITLAAANAYTATAAREGLATARRWGVILVAAITGAAWLSAKTTWPFGPIYYTEMLGRRLGPVPLCVPLLWLTVLLGARDLARRLRPSLGQGPLALASGVLVLLFDLALEPLAWKARVFWLWYPGRLPAPSHPPLQNYVAWFLLGAGLTFALREKRVASLPSSVYRSPAAIYVLLLTVLLLAQLSRLAG